MLRSFTYDFYGTYNIHAEDHCILDLGISDSYLQMMERIKNDESPS
jgi:hypothetical protein